MDGDAPPRQARHDSVPVPEGEALARRNVGERRRSRPPSPPDQRQALRAIVAPARVAVVGATEKEGSVGRTVLWNLIPHPIGGTVFPVNPKRTSVLGIKAYPDLASLPEPVDLAVVATPAPGGTSSPALSSRPGRRTWP